MKAADEYGFEFVVNELGGAIASKAILSVDTVFDPEVAFKRAVGSMYHETTDMAREDFDAALFMLLSSGRVRCEDGVYKIVLDVWEAAQFRINMVSTRKKVEINGWFEGLIIGNSFELVGLNPKSIIAEEVAALAEVKPPKQRKPRFLNEGHITGFHPSRESRRGGHHPQNRGRSRPFA